MSSLFVSALLLGAQLLATGAGTLPQVLAADYPSSEVVVGDDAEVKVALTVRDGYLINHTPPMQLKLEPVPGLTLAESTISSPPLDPDSTDVYYVNVPDFTIGVTAARPGTYTLSGELVYFFCSQADGFCARQTLDVAVPVVAD
jgi:hypothetical protein